MVRPDIIDLSSYMSIHIVKSWGSCYDKRAFEEVTSNVSQNRSYNSGVPMLENLFFFVCNLLVP